MFTYLYFWILNIFTYKLIFKIKIIIISLLFIYSIFSKCIVSIIFWEQIYSNPNKIYFKIIHSHKNNHIQKMSISINFDITNINWSPILDMQPITLLIFMYTMNYHTKFEKKINKKIQTYVLTYAHTCTHTHTHRLKHNFHSKLSGIYALVLSVCLCVCIYVTILKNHYRTKVIQLEW